jgi:PAS domain S-box-containing protein
MSRRINRAMRRERTRKVNECKKGESLLRHADVLRRAFEGAKDAIFVLDSKVPPVIVECNRAACEIFGYKKSEMIGRTTVFLHASDESLRKFQEQLYKAIEKNGYFNLEHEMKRRDGFAFPSDHTVTELIGDDRKRMGWVSVVKDMTERKRMEDAIRRRADELAALEATVLDITSQLELPDLLKLIVERACRLLGVPSGSLYLSDPQRREARCIVAYRQPKDYAQTVLKYGEGASGLVAFTGEPLIIDDYRTWKGRAAMFEKERPFVSVLCVPMKWKGQVIGTISALDNAPHHFTQANQDLLSSFANHAATAVENARLLDEERQHATELERMVAERTKALAESERRFRELSDLLPETVFESDSNGKLTFVNQAGFESTGYARDDLRHGLNASQMFVAEDRSRVAENMRRILDGEKSRGNEYTMQRKDGTTFPVMAHSSPIIRDGRTVGLRGIIVDITERKQLEQRLIRAERLAAIGETAAMVGHDLRNPLQGISGALHVLRQKSGSNADAESAEMLKLIEAGLEYADKIVEELLDYSREIHLEPTETTPRAVTMAALLQLEIPQNVVINDLTQDIPRLLVDKAKTQRVFVNLIGNAIDSMPRGGELTITSAESNGVLEVKFTDTGEGIPDDVMRNLWKPFKTTKSRGMGLGLAISKRIVEAHGGSIEAESTLGKGSTFTVKLPMSKKEETILREHLD